MPPPALHARSRDPDVLVGDRVRLEPLERGHVPGLVAAATEDRSSYAFTTVPADRASMARYVDELVRDREVGEAVPFAQVSVATGRVVGATRFLHLRRTATTGDIYAVEIGGTWLAASAQHSGANVEAKLLMLRLAFDTWRVGRVELLTDARNERSRAAIAAIGATFEGVLRSAHESRVAGEEGSLRDSAIYSVTAAEWPAVQRVLEARLERARPPA